MVPTLYLFTGPPASGKSTVAKRLRAQVPDAIYISSDELIERYARYIGKSYNDVFQKAIKRATKRVNKLVQLAKEKQLDVIWDQCNLTMEDRRNKAYKFDGYRQVLYYAPKWGLGTLKERNKGRDRSPLSSVVMNKMYSLYQFPSEAEKELWDETYCFIDLPLPSWGVLS